MLGLIFIYFVGKAFYNLAGEHNKNQWVFAILGVVSYYAGLFLGAILIGVFIETFTGSSVDDYSDNVITLMSIPIGIVTCWGTYKLLQQKWSAPKPQHPTTEILDRDL